MINDKEREIIKATHEKGKSKKEIARFFEHDVKTVRSILAGGNNEAKMRKDKIVVDEELLHTLYQECNGYKQRIYEKLTEEKGIKIGYSTLTRLLREYRMGKEEERSKSYPDIPGEEMQQDTSVYYVMIGDKKMKVICSGIYFRYSKMRYVKFYLRYCRFNMKCFFYEALISLGYCARICIIDNTNLAVWYGTGEHAVFNPEMVLFAKQFGFAWKAHRIRHANRKAGKERNFFTLETNFLPGRRFASLNDLNNQARQWCLEQFADGNFYWLPEKIKGQVRILEYEKRIVIYQAHKELIGYELPGAGVKNQRITPAGMEDVLRQQPRNLKKGYEEEEKQLRASGTIVAAYLDYVLSPECTTKQKPRFVRELYRLSKQMTKELVFV